MKITIIKIVILLCFCMPGISAGSGSLFNDRSGTTLLEWCKPAASYLPDRPPDKMSDALSAMGCMGYVEGIIEATPLYEDPCKNDNNPFCLALKEELRNNSFCLPAGVTLLQEIKVIVMYLELHPEQLHEHSFSLVKKALIKAFPCK